MVNKYTTRATIKEYYYTRYLFRIECHFHVQLLFHSSTSSYLIFLPGIVNSSATFGAVEVFDR
jgi:hypothetical protein